MSRPRSWTTILKTGLGTITGLSVLYSFFLLGPAIETRYFPVLGTMRITTVQPLTEQTSAVRTEFEKLRDCEYMGIAWYRGPSTGIFERVSMVPIRDPDDTSSPNRATGIQSAGPWRIAMQASEIRDRSFVQAYHRCHPFWTTMSRFYP